MEQLGLTLERRNLGVNIVATGLTIPMKVMEGGIQPQNLKWERAEQRVEAISVVRSIRLQNTRDAAKMRHGADLQSNRQPVER